MKPNYKYFCLLVVAALMGTPASAKNEKIRLPSSDVLPESIHISVTYGEKTTDFLITSEKRSCRISMTSNQGEHREKTIQATDVEYLISKIQEVSPKLEASNRCSRQWVYVATSRTNGEKDYEASACLSEKTETARGLLGIANLLSSWL